MFVNHVSLGFISLTLTHAKLAQIFVATARIRRLVLHAPLGMDSIRHPLNAICAQEHATNAFSTRQRALRSVFRAQTAFTYLIVKLAYNALNSVQLALPVSVLYAI